MFFQNYSHAFSPCWLVVHTFPATIVPRVKNNPTSRMHPGLSPAPIQGGWEFGGSEAEVVLNAHRESMRRLLHPSSCMAVTGPSRYADSMLCNSNPACWRRGEISR